MHHNNKQHVFLSVSRFAVEEVCAKAIFEQADVKGLNKTWSVHRHYELHLHSDTDWGQRACCILLDCLQKDAI